MNKLTVIIGLCLVVLVVAAAVLLLPPRVNAPTQQDQEPTSFIECAAMGYPVAESYPRKCTAPSGGSFVEDIGTALDKIDLIKENCPRWASYIGAGSSRQ